MTEQNAWDLGGTGESFPFDKIGDKVSGFIVDSQLRQGTDLDSGELSWWDKEKTRPVMLTVITLQTELKESPSDDGRRNVTLAGSKKPAPDGGKSRMCAALMAVKEGTGGGTNMEQGAYFEMEFVGEGPKTKPAYSPPKYFEAKYKPPVIELDGNGQAQAQPQSTSAGNTVQSQGLPDPKTSPVSREVAAAMEAVGADPAQAFGADWRSRLV